MWVWRALIFSLSIALFVATASPARAAEYQAHLTADVTYSASQTCSVLDNTDQVPGTQNNDNVPGKVPVYQVIVNPNVSLPPVERQAASAFGTLLQNEPIFVLAFEFLPEILDLKHFLAPLNINYTLPWYLRADAANKHGRLAGWKDGNTLYSGSITYLS